MITAGGVEVHVLAIRTAAATIEGVRCIAFDELVSTASHGDFLPMLIVVIGCGVPDVDVLAIATAAPTVEGMVRVSLLVGEEATSTINLFKLLVDVSGVRCPEVEVLTVSSATSTVDGEAGCVALAHAHDRVATARRTVGSLRDGIPASTVRDCSASRKVDPGRVALQSSGVSRVIDNGQIPRREVGGRTFRTGEPAVTIASAAHLNANAPIERARAISDGVVVPGACEMERRGVANFPDRVVEESDLVSCPGAGRVFTDEWTYRSVSAAVGDSGTIGRPKSAFTAQGGDVAHDLSGIVCQSDADARAHIANLAITDGEVASVSLDRSPIDPSDARAIGTDAIFLQTEAIVADLAQVVTPHCFEVHIVGRGTRASFGENGAGSAQLSFYITAFHHGISCPLEEDTMTISTVNEPTILEVI